MAELDVQRRLTDAFIARQPVTIILVPHTRTRTPSGGYDDLPGTPRAPQDMTIVQPPDPDFPVFGPDGRERRSTYELIGKWDAVIGLYDRFTVPGQSGEWKVTQLYFDNGWEKRAQVSQIG